jgi:hypothetical protein
MRPASNLRLQAARRRVYLGVEGARVAAGLTLSAFVQVSIWSIGLRLSMLWYVETPGLLGSPSSPGGDGLMDEHSRARIAYVAGRIITNRNASSIFDYTRGRYKLMSGRADSASVSVFDHERGSHLTGSGTSFFDHEKGFHISLHITGNKFSGFDYESSSHYSGTVSGNTISVFDYGEGGFTQYSI